MDWKTRSVMPLLPGSRRKNLLTRIIPLILGDAGEHALADLLPANVAVAVGRNLAVGDSRHADRAEEGSGGRGDQRLVQHFVIVKGLEKRSDSGNGI